MLLSFISKLKADESITQQDYYKLQQFLLSSSFESQDLIEIFRLLENTDLTKDHILGLMQASKEKTVDLETKMKTLDIVGTGGDKLNTFNISTLSGILVAASGIPVAKHGNRAASSLCGSGDVLEELGVKIELTSQQAKVILEKTGFVFLFAKSFNPAFGYVSNSRKIYGRKTYFNILGPLLNPTNPKFLLLGLSDFSKAKMMGEVLIESGIRRAWIVQSDIGMDEISCFGETKVLEVSNSGENNNIIKEFIIDPKNFGYDDFNLEDIQGGDKIVNAQIFTQILQANGTRAQNATVILNCAAAMTIYGKTKDMQEGVELSKEILKSGLGWAKFVEFRDLSNQV